MASKTSYVICKRYEDNAFWGYRGWTDDLRGARRFASRESAVRYARCEVDGRSWTVMPVDN